MYWSWWACGLVGRWMGGRLGGWACGQVSGWMGGWMGTVSAVIVSRFLLVIMIMNRPYYEQVRNLLPHSSIDS